MGKEKEGEPKGGRQEVQGRIREADKETKREKRQNKQE